MNKPTTALCEATPEDIRLHGRSLPNELMGQVGFTELVFQHLTGERPTPGQVRLLDACLLAMMEHGLTPTAVTARLTYTSAPEALQGAVAAGLSSVGSLFAGTMDGCAALLQRIVAGEDAVELVAQERAAGRRVPGFGHPLHRPVDPRAVRLLAIANEEGLQGAYCRALADLEQAVLASASKPVPLNATGAIAAVLLDAGLQAHLLRGVALIARCAGLLGHIREESENPTLGAIWRAAEAAVPFANPEQEEE